MPENGEAFFEGSQAHVFLRADGSAIRKLKRRTTSTAMKAAAQLLQMSQHPNMVRIFAIENGDICMEAMHVSLQQHMPRGQTYNFHVKLHIALAIAHGIHHLHTHNMDHGDLCPSNILLACTPGKMPVKLCDFYSENNGIRRTAAYASPEVVLAPKRTMCPADVWALACCILFLEGVEPFSGFQEDHAKFFYLGLHQCVAFQEADGPKQFRLQDCEHAPARHIGGTLWAHMLHSMFAPEASRPTSQQVVDRLRKMRALKTRVPLRHVN
jgi:serine/threonine protein kinase